MSGVRRPTRKERDLGMTGREVSEPCCSCWGFSPMATTTWAGYAQKDNAPALRLPRCFRARFGGAGGVLVKREGRTAECGRRSKRLSSLACSRGWPSLGELFAVVLS